MEGDLIDFNSSDICGNSVFENYSPSVLNMNIDFNGLIPSLNGRESLGILSNSFINDELSTCDMFLQDNSVICQRNSLGNTNQLIYDLNAQNVDFLSSDTRFSIDSNGLSRIYPFTTNSTVLNNGFFDMNLFNNNSQLKHLTLPLQRSRIKSLPSDLIRNKTLLETVKEGVSQPDLTKANLQKSDNEIIDLLYVEARGIADKIADGSIFDDSGEGGSCLNSTAEPVFKDISEKEPVIEKEFECKDIFKSVDKMLPPTLSPSMTGIDTVKIFDNNASVPEGNENLKETTDSITVSTKCEVCKNVIKLLQSNTCKDSVKHTNVRELLVNLTDLALLDNKSEEVIDECFNLTVNLLHLIITSSMKTTKHVEVIVDSNMSDGLHPLDLSVKSNTGERYSKENISPVIKNKATTLKNFMQNDLQQKQFKLKPKKISDSKLGTNRGPMKAIAPITNCLKTKDDNIKLTDMSLKSNLPNIAKSSTPCKSKMKPIAQSTPENDPNRHLSDSSIKSELHSPVSRKNSSNIMRYQNEEKEKNSLTYSNANISSKSFARRGSTSDLKRDNANKLTKRSNSIGDSTTAAAASRAREMVSKKIASFQQNNSLKKSNNLSYKTDNNNKSGLTENKRMIKANLKPFSLISKLKIGKENAAP